MPVMMYKGIPYGEGTNTLDGLKDVDISSPSAGDILKYNSSTGKFENGEPLVGGRIRVDYNVTLFDQTVETWVDSLTYTATQDCFVNVIVKGDGYSSPLVYVNGNILRFFNSTDVYEHETTLILKKGDTISKRTSSDTGSVYYRFVVYPIYYDNGGHDYSTTEQVVGTWIDGSPMYEKTVSETITNSSEQVIATVVGAEYKRIDGFVSTSSGVIPIPFNDGSSFYVPYTDSDDVKLAKSSASQGIGNTIVLTIQYTKSSSWDNNNPPPLS